MTLVFPRGTDPTDLAKETKSMLTSVCPGFENGMIEPLRVEFDADENILIVVTFAVDPPESAPIWQLFVPHQDFVES